MTDETTIEFSAHGVSLKNPIYRCVIREDDAMDEKWRPSTGLNIFRDGQKYVIEFSGTNVHHFTAFHGASNA